MQIRLISTLRKSLEQLVSRTGIEPLTYLNENRWRTHCEFKRLAKDSHSPHYYFRQIETLGRCRKWQDTSRYLYVKPYKQALIRLSSTNDQKYPLFFLLLFVTRCIYRKILDQFVRKTLTGCDKIGHYMTSPSIFLFYFNKLRIQ